MCNSFNPYIYEYFEGRINLRKILVALTISQNDHFKEETKQKMTYAENLLFDSDSVKNGLATIICYQAAGSFGPSVSPLSVATVCSVTMWRPHVVCGGLGRRFNL